jgi:hypothetical protein
MTRLLDDDQLRALGLDPARLGETTTVPWPEEDAAHGRSVSDVAAVGVAAALSFAPASVPVAEVLGISIHQAEEEPRILKLVGPPGVSADVRMLPPATAGLGPRPAASLRDPHDPATVRMDLRPWMSAAGVIILPSGHGLAITPRPDGLKVVLIVPAPITLAPFAQIESPVAGWISERHEPWLRQEIQARLARANAWQHAVAVGLFARLAVASEQAAPTPDGKGDLARPRRWARNLERAQIATLELLVKAEVERLLAVIDELTQTMACDDQDWRSELLELCRGRDDVEGVRILLNEAGADDTVTDTVRFLDEAGSQFVRSLPVVLKVEDERLHRVASFDHGAWWVALAGSGG